MLPKLDTIAQTKSWDSLTTDEQCRVLAGESPVILRGYVKHWPVVVHAHQSFASLRDYLLAFDSGLLFDAMLAAPAEAGRLFYGASLESFNFKPMKGRLRDAFEILGSLQDKVDGPTFYIGSKAIPEYLPGLERECSLDVLDTAIAPNIWIGNRTIVAAHNDNAENIACVAAGRRRFTLFPPDQGDNLYIADAPNTPGGRPISLVDLRAPNFKVFPNFSKALACAQVAHLDTGDALYIPTHWWHYVEALDPVNILVNFWWSGKPTRFYG